VSTPWLIACRVTYQNILVEKFEGLTRMRSLSFPPIDF